MTAKHLARRVLAFAFSLFAAAAGAAPTLNLDEALALAERSSPRLRAAEAQAEGARAGILTARAYPNPDLSAQIGRQNARRIDAAEGSTQSVGVAQPIDLPSVRSARIRSAEAGREGSELALEEMRLAVRASVQQAFFEVLRRKTELEIASDTQKLIDDIRRRIEVRVNVGESPRLELTRAEAEAASAASLVASARLRITQALATLRAVIGAPLPDGVEVVGDLPGAVTLPPFADLRDEVLARYPALAQAQAEVRRAQARLETERALRTPQPTLLANVERDPDIDKIQFGIALPIPVWNQRQGQIGEAVATFQAATATAEQRRLEVLAALEGAYGRYQVTSEQIAALEGGILKQAEAALRAAEAAYRFGERGFIEVLDAQRVLRAARLDFLHAQYDRQAALLEIEQLRAVGASTKGN